MNAPIQLRSEVSLEDLHREILLALRTAQADAARLDSVSPLLAPLVASHEKCSELRRREIARQVVPSLRGAYAVVDLEARRLAWTHAGPDAGDDVSSIPSHEATLLAIAEQALAADGGIEGVAAHHDLPCGRVTRVVDLGRPSAFGNKRSVLLAIESHASDVIEALDGSAAGQKLSRREREIANLLVAGYAAINAAAVLELSEHTVRTYIRRLYRKLDVSNRADLVRKMMSSVPPRSQELFLI